MNVKEFEIQLALGTIKWRTDKKYEDLEDANWKVVDAVKDDVHYFASKSRSKVLLMYLVNHKRLAEGMVKCLIYNNHFTADMMERLLCRPQVRRWYKSSLNDNYTSCLTDELMRMISKGELTVVATKSKK